MTATLRTIPAPNLGPDSQLIVLDCPHGTTTAHVLAARQVVEIDQIVRVTAARHEAEEHCGCALPLLTSGARA
jgi:Mrp family chromosome partitioning ATPase